MRPPAPSRVLALFSLVLAGCGGQASSPASAASPAAPPASESGGGDAPSGPTFRPAPTTNVQIHNACADAVPVYFGEQPNGGGANGDFVTLRGSGTSHVPRREHGELTVWIVDDKAFGLAHVKVTRKMNKVEIGPSCRTLHAE